MGTGGGTLYSPSSGLVPLYPSSQRCGLCQDFKQTTLTTGLYKVRTNLYPTLTKTFRRACFSSGQAEEFRIRSTFHEWYAYVLNIYPTLSPARRSASAVLCFCVSVCVCHMSVFCWNVWTDQASFFCVEAPSTYSTPCRKEMLLSQNVVIEHFAMAHRSLQRVANYLDRGGRSLWYAVWMSSVQ